MVEHGECSGQSEAGGAGVSIGFVTERGGAGTEHFGVRFDLAVDFESDGGNILHRAGFFEANAEGKEKPEVGRKWTLGGGRRNLTARGDLFFALICR